MTAIAKSIRRNTAKASLFQGIRRRNTEHEVRNKLETEVEEVIKKAELMEPSLSRDSFSASCNLQDPIFYQSNTTGSEHFVMPDRDFNGANNADSPLPVKLDSDMFSLASPLHAAD